MSLDREFVAIDLETTGLSPRLDRVIEVGAVRFRGHEVIDRYEALVDPGMAIPLVVQRLTGITDRKVQGAASSEDALARLKGFVGNAPLVGHGAHFDVAFLATGASDAFELYDTLDLARILLPAVPSHSLPLLTRSMKLAHPRAHRALADADAARQLFLTLGETARQLPAALLDEMLQLMAGWHHPLRTFLAAAREAGAGAAAISPPVEPDAPRGQRPTGPPPPFRSASLPDLLGPDGPMAHAHPDFELREGQQQMALAVGQTFERGGRLVVEAGPGTGKSLAYLIPAVLWARAHDQRVLVSTNTITLQEQLAQKDIPALRRWLPMDFEAALLKGRSHYLSKRRWLKFLQTPTLQQDGRRAAEEMKFKLRLLVWLGQTQVGDRAEIRLGGPDEPFWAQAASDPNDCLGTRCPTYRTCFFWNSRRAANSADLVITNHALLLADVDTGGRVLPPYEHLIVDEAHHLEEAATHSLTARVGEVEFRARLQDALRWTAAVQGHGGTPLASGLVEAAATVETLWHEVFRAVAGFLRAFENGIGGEDRVAFDATHRQSPEFRPVREAVEALAGPFRALLIQLESPPTQGDLALDAGISRAAHELALHVGVLRARLEVLQQAVLAPLPERVYWAALDRRTARPLVQAAPLEVGTLLQARAFDPKHAVVLTSASLSLGQSFEFFKSRVGLADRSVEELTLPSPFDYLSQALLCLPTDLHDPNDPAFVSQVGQVVSAVAAALEGRTLVLFTSHSQLKEVYDSVQDRLSAQGIGVLGQNLDGTRRQVLQQFREHSRTVLLGTSSFWEGIDLHSSRTDDGSRTGGDALACVIIVRLPFKVPTDPIQAARSATLADGFGALALPEAVLRLKQGFGRLIRRQSDRGAVILLDNRVANKTYGRHFLDALPKAACFTGACDELASTVQEWVRRPARLVPR
jgi:DNA polymerase-3 subunit epsilon/ATP-dependent DNA helicase DinG